MNPIHKIISEGITAIIVGALFGYGVDSILAGAAVALIYYRITTVENVIQIMLRK